MRVSGFGGEEGGVADGSVNVSPVTGQAQGQPLVLAWAESALPASMYPSIPPLPDPISLSQTMTSQMAVASECSHATLDIRADGHLPGYPASHGCIRLPLPFAKSLFAITKLDQEVVVLKDTSTPVKRTPPKPEPTVDPAPAP